MNNPICNNEQTQLTTRKRLTIVSCSVYGQEVMALSRAGRINFPIRFADSAFHMRPSQLQSRLQTIIDEERADNRSVVLIYGDCSSSMSTLVEQQGVYRVEGNNCGGIFLGKELYKSLMKKGAFLLFPEWVDRWKQILLNFPGMDPDLACTMMGEMHKKFVYIDTGVRPVPYEQIQACSDFFKLPYEILEITLDHLEQRILDAIGQAPEDLEVVMNEKPQSFEDQMSVRDRNSTALMLLDITTSVLMAPEETQLIISNLSQKIRELTGAQTSALITIEKNGGNHQPAHKTLVVSPNRRANLVNGPDAERLVADALSLKEACILRAPENEESAAASSLYPCLALPLRNGTEIIGYSLAMGLIDETFSGLIMEIQDVLSSVVGVILNNALLMERQRVIQAELKVEINERRKAETELQQEKQRLSYVLEGTNVGSWEINFKTLEMTVNEQDAKVLGYAYKQKMQSAEWEEKIHPEDLGIRAEALEKHLKGESNLYDCTFRRQRDDGSWIWVLSRGKVLIWDDDGSPLIIYGTHMDVTERQEAVEQAMFLSNHDPLTGLPNLRLAQDRLSKSINSAIHSSTLVAILFIDLDGFKQVNDNYGHDMGDFVLQVVASRLNSCVRSQDTVARVGGDEFLVILTRIIDPEKAALVAGRITESIVTPILAKERQDDFLPIRIGASIGISIFPDHSQDAETLIRMADEAMYEVKKSGKDGYRFATRLNK